MLVSLQYSLDNGTAAFGFSSSAGSRYFKALGTRHHCCDHIPLAVMKGYVYTSFRDMYNLVCLQTLHRMHCECGWAA